MVAVRVLLNKPYNSKLIPNTADIYGYSSVPMSCSTELILCQLQCNKTLDCPQWSNSLDLLNKILTNVSMFGINWTPLVLIAALGNDIL